VRWILFPHAMNYHVEHHLYPSVPHYRLAECHRKLRAAGALDDAEVVPTISETFRRIFAPPTQELDKIQL
jgi:fatty acid desaturase